MPASAFDSCGRRPVKADGTPWSCTFVDTFAGTALVRLLLRRPAEHLGERWRPAPHGAVGPLGPWPLAGEIDIVETYSQYPGLGVPYLHYTATDNGGPVPGLNTAWDCPAERGVYNTYTLEWTATSIQSYINGASCLLNTSGNPAFMKKYILNLTQALGYGSNSYTGTAPMPATMDVDYVKVWQ